MMCASQVEATDYVLLAAVSQTMFPSEQRRSIRRHLERVHATAVEKVRASAMTASPVKEALLSFLQRTTTVTWPEEAFTPQNDPSSNYSQSTSAYDDGNVFTWWRSLRERLQRSMVSQQQAAIAKLPRLDTRAVTWYDPVLDVISVSYTALAPPLYYKRGTSAMLYGGIGFIYAREIAQALGVLTTLVDDGGHIIAPSDRAMSFTLWNNMTCPHLEPSDVETMFPSLPALEIAHAVYLKYRDPKYDLPVKGLEKYTAEQIFFITFCLATCHVEFLGMSLSRFCNSAVENFQPFARAFSCPPGSRMNLERKCRFF
ncbi:hypothetical protein V5799_026224 [Amblyomma americanum]|uniref:Peptidase M13 C-terminal domain-containing protein n=1 Tax=Amblyomma americanum TaxID=6943 RepID=A0AAQ4DJ69_AMBAM